MENDFANLKLVFVSKSDLESGALRRNVLQNHGGTSNFTSNASDGQDTDIELQFPAFKSSLDQNPPDGTDQFNMNQPEVQIQLELDFSENKSKKTWSYNYQEAAIYLSEGQANNKFNLHPKGEQALKLYLKVHQNLFHRLHFFAALTLLLLTLFEKPAIGGLEINPIIHALIELIALFFLTCELILRIKWTGIKAFVHHHRSLMTSVILTLMLVEALVVLARQNVHFRFSRAFRPLFLINSDYCNGVRRVLRQIIQSLPPIVDMLVLLLFCILLYALSAFYLFSDNELDPHFTTLERSFVSLFILLTTANFPDVMMPAYARSKWSAIFFISYLILSLYFLMNLMLAVVYETFTRMEKQKFRKLLLHRRAACEHAFKLLKRTNQEDYILFVHFRGLMAYFRPQMSLLECYLTFKTLDRHRTGCIDLKQFYRIYEVIDLHWCPMVDPQPPSSALRRACVRIVNWFAFEYLIYAIITLSVVWQLKQAHTIQSYTSFSDLCVFSASAHSTACTATTASTSGSATSDDYLRSLQTSGITVSFIVLFAIECIVRRLATTHFRYWSDMWNRFDLTVTCASAVGFAASFVGYPFAYVYVLRSLRLLRLFATHKRYEDVMGTFMFILLRRFLSVFMVVIIVFYAFAVFGMEFFAGLPLKNCCNGTELESYFRSNTTSDATNGYYYLNNFDDILVSYVTLFQLMVANNWHIIMGGFALVSTEWSRLYFMLFYIITMVVITIVVAFVLEAFLFRIQFEKRIGSFGRQTKVMYDVYLNEAEYDFCLNTNQIGFNKPNLITDLYRFSNKMNYEFHGQRTRTKFLFSLQMYAQEVHKWIHQEEKDRQLFSVPTVSESKCPIVKRRTLSCSY